MKLSDLSFDYPESLVALERAETSRVMWFENGEAKELSRGVTELIEKFEPGDVLVLNDSKVLKRRVFSETNLEILFLKAVSALEWEVLCPASRWKNGTKQILPGAIELEVVSRGRPQVVKSNLPLTEDYFQKHGELPLPPYIQKARGERHNRAHDEAQYQTEWAAAPGSLAAPTASLHFNDGHLRALNDRGVLITKLTLHVGLGTFLPITVDNLDDHLMHSEQVEIPPSTWSKIQNARTSGKKVWALGTTVARSLESAAHGKLAQDVRAQGGYFGETNLFIRPGFEFRVVDRLCTNFHQPESTLLALVGAFVGLEAVKRSYKWAIEQKFRLFSYGDLTVWTR